MTFKEWLNENSKIKLKKKNSLVNIMLVILMKIIKVENYQFIKVLKAGDHRGPIQQSLRKNRIC